MTPVARQLPVVFPDYYCYGNSDSTKTVTATVGRWHLEISGEKVKTVGAVVRLTLGAGGCNPAVFSRREQNHTWEAGMERCESGQDQYTKHASYGALHHGYACSDTLIYVVGADTSDMCKLQFPSAIYFLRPHFD